MLSLNLPADVAYFAFVIWVFAIFLAISWYKPNYRGEMNFMSFWGGIGGVCVAQLYRMDFWQPLSILSFSAGSFLVTIEDYAFGGAFTGITTVLWQICGHRYLEPEAKRMHGHQQSLNKLARLFSVLMIGVIVYIGLGSNTMGATSIAFLSSIFILYWGRRNLLQAALWGGLWTLLVYVGIVGSFLLVVGNRTELATRLCQYYVAHGVGTGIVLCIWAFTFGTFMTPLYAWITNQRFVED